LWIHLYQACFVKSRGNVKIVSTVDLLCYGAVK
jgi:hypothetical protein